jgi:starch-binding outer membrane protein, SusD/RagB family
MRKMTSYKTTKAAGRMRRSAALAASLAVLVGGAMGVTACDTSDLVSVETPDIIDPSDVQSAAGAEAVRIGALARFVQATTGTESLLLLGGMFADEWVNGDTFIARHELDRRDVNIDNTFLLTAARNLHRARLSAEQAVALLAQWIPNAPGWQVAEMFLIQAYLVNLAAEHYCDGLVFSTVVDGVETFGSPITTVAAFERALGHADDGLARITGTTTNDQRVQNALRVIRGRILMNLNRPADAATAVAAVPTAFRYQTFHSSTSFDNATWWWNNSQRRYSVSNSEGINGLNFATADDPRVPVCEAPCPQFGVIPATREDASRPLHVQLLWPTRESPVTLIDGIAARMIEAEAQLRAPNVTAMAATLNAARTTVEGLDPLDEPATVAAATDLLFRERAFWHFGRGQRFGDLRRLVRQYGRAPDTVFPTGNWHKGGATYGSDVNIPLEFAELNNPNVSELCMNRNP